MRSPLTFLDPSFSFRRLLTTPAKKPRTECCCQPVAFIIAAIVAPSGRLSSLITAACLELVRDLPWCGFFEATVLGRPLLPIEAFTLLVRLLLAIREPLVVASTQIVLPPPQPRGGLTALAGRSPEPAN